MDADAPRPHGDDLTVGRQPAESDQGTDQKREGEGENKYAGQQVEHRPAHGGEFGMPSNEEFGQAPEFPGEDHEAEYKQRHQDGTNGFQPDDPINPFHAPRARPRF